MVEKLLDEITGIDGVEGTYIFSTHLDILDRSGIKLNTKQLTALSTYLLRIVSAFYNKGKKATELEFYWQNRYIICKISDHFIIVAFCRTSRILAFLRITLNVTAAKLLDDKKFTKWLKAHRADRKLILHKGNMDSAEKQFVQHLYYDSDLYND
jgi:hypothetical protein